MNLGEMTGNLDMVWLKWYKDSQSSGLCLTLISQLGIIVYKWQWSPIVQSVMSELLGYGVYSTFYKTGYIIQTFFPKRLND